MKVSDKSTYLEAAALEGDVTVTIESVRDPGPKDVGTDGRAIDPKNVIIRYKGAKKEHIACRTVQKQIRHITGEDDMTKWTGQKITLYRHILPKCFGEKNVPCIRVRGKSL